MTLDQLRKRLARASVGDVHKLTGIPLRTLHRFKATGVVPKYQTVMALTKWAEKQ